MNLATIADGSRDGRLVAVSHDHRRAAFVSGIPTLQRALDDWPAAEPRLRAAADAADAGAKGAIPFDENMTLSPLPRAYQWCDGSAYVNHVQLVRRARGAEMPPSFWTDPLMYQGGSDGFLAPHEPIVFPDEGWGIDFEAEVAVIVDDVPVAASRDAARAAIRLVLLANDVSLRNLVPGEIAKGFGFFHAKPPTAFSPLALTPDELGRAWDGDRLSLPLLSFVNGDAFGRPDAGIDMTFDFPALIVHAAKTRPLAAGTIVGSGTVSNRDAEGGPGRPLAAGGTGYSCLAEQRVVETILTGKPQTPFLRFGDVVRIEMRDAAGHSLFGSIEQRVERHGG